MKRAEAFGGWSSAAAAAVFSRVNETAFFGRTFSRPFRWK